MPNAYRGAGITIAGPLPSLLDRQACVLSGHVTPLCNSRSSAAVAVPKGVFLMGLYVKNVFS